MPEDSPPSGMSPRGFNQALKDRYAIEAEVGAGGMGIVYQAHDIRHDRKVALKVLRPEIAASVGTERFLREIRIEAGLNHPHILPVYDSGEVDGTLYCVMPFIEGESLQDRLDREQQLPCDEALRICREIADALSFAHTHDVIHRDVKPANILLEAGHAVLADFGLAKALTTVEEQGLTRAGFAVGTPAYSSPEQSTGDGKVDGRSDLYSLGCVLYEMLAGKPPFVGPSADSVVRQHLALEPSSVRVLRPAVPPAAEEILDRLLAKSPADRFRSADELIKALDAAVSGEWATSKRPPKAKPRAWKRIALPGTVTLVVMAAGISWLARGSGPIGAGNGDLLDPRDIAVLYFEDLSGEGDLGHVADGLTEGLISELSHVNELNVLSWNATAPFREGDAAPDSIAEALEVGTLVQGSVEEIGDRLHITVRLIEGISGADFDRRAFDVPESELLAAQDSVIQEVAWLLRERLGEEIRLRRRRAGTSEVEAWALVQRGERERKVAERTLEQGNLEETFAAFGRADSLFALAETVDPRWVEPVTARGWIAYRESRLALNLGAAVDGIDRGLGHAERALAIDPNFPRALELRGTVQYWHWILNLTPDPEEGAALLGRAQEDLEAAVRADRSLASAHSTLSHLYYQVSDLTNALISAREAYQADAYLNVADDVLWRLFLASYDTELLPQARSWCNEGSQRFPDDYRFGECKIWEMTFPSVTPDPEEAWRLRERTVELTPEPLRELMRHKTMIIVAGVLAEADLPDSARSVLAEARAGADVDPNRELPFIEAHIRTVLTDYDEAVRLLGTYLGGAGAAGGGGGIGWANHWWWDDLRGHSGFQRLLEASR